MTDDATSLEIPGVLPADRTPGARLADGRAIAGGLWEVIKNVVKRPFYSLYLRRLRSKSHAWKHPRHLGVIMDGNRRFARQAGFASVLAGHRLGAEKLQEVLQWCHDTEIPVVTVWCFSLENFQRSAHEVEDLLGLFEDKTREMANGGQVHEHRIRVRFIGRLELLPEGLRHEIRRVEEATRDYDQLQLNIAMAYGGREEIADAFRRHIAEKVEAGEPIDRVLSSLDASSIASYLYTSGPARARSDLAHLRRDSPLRLSVVAERPFGVLFQRHQLASVSRDRFSPGPEGL